MTEPRTETEQAAAAAEQEHYFDPSHLEEEWEAYTEHFYQLLRQGKDAEVARIAEELTPGDLSEIIRPLSVEDTARIIQLLPTDVAADVLAEIDERNLPGLLELLDIEAIADMVEDMPSDEATDLIGGLEDARAREILAAMEATERAEVRELLQYGPETAGGLMAKEFIAVPVTATCREAVEAVRTLDPDDREQLHFIYVVDEQGRLVGRIPLVEMLLQPWSTPVREVMEPDPLRVRVDLDQEQVVQFVRTHDLVILPVVDEQDRLVGVIAGDDVLDVMEDEATEDISRLAGTSEELGETSPVRVARARLPWLLGALTGEIACIFMMQHFQASLEQTVALTFFIPSMMAMGGNTGNQTAYAVVRGLATGEVNLRHLGRHVLRELTTTMLTGSAIAVYLFVIAMLIVGDLYLAGVLGVSLVAVVLFATLVGSSVPLLLHRVGVDPAIATGPFISTSNDFFGVVIYLSIASVMLGR